MPIYYRIRFKYGKREGKLFVYASDLATYQKKKPASEGDHGTEVHKESELMETLRLAELLTPLKIPKYQYIVIELGPSKYITIEWGMDGLKVERLNKVKDEERYRDTGKTARVDKVIGAAITTTFKETDPMDSKLTAEHFVRSVISIASIDS